MFFLTSRSTLFFKANLVLFHYDKALINSRKLDLSFLKPELSLMLPFRLVNILLFYFLIFFLDFFISFIKSSTSKIKEARLIPTLFSYLLDNTVTAKVRRKDSNSVKRCIVLQNCVLLRVQQIT